MKYNLLGSTGIEVSTLCFGTLTISPLQRNFDIERGAALLKSAHDMGVTFFDTAEIYDSYKYLKKAFAGAQDVIISTKSYSYDETTAKKSLEKSLKELGRDYIDIFMLHEQESEYTLRGHREAIEYFLKMKQQGIIGAFGVSTHHVACVIAASKHPEIDVVFPIYNMRGLGIADGGKEDMESAVRKAFEAGKGILAMKPLGGGHMYADPANALNYVLDSPYVHSVALGIQSEEELIEDCAFFSGNRDIKFTKGTEKRIMVHDWCRGCGSCAEACSSRALSLVDGKIVIDQSRCVFCGYCGAACPDFAIKVI